MTRWGRNPDRRSRLRPARPLGLAAALAACLAVAWSFEAAGAGQPTPRSGLPADADAAISLRREIILSRLVDLAADRAGVNVQYDAAVLGKESVTLRLREEISDRELWLITNQALATRGFAFVRLPGEGSERTLSVVRLADAATIAGIRDLLGGGVAEGQSPAGFVSAVSQVEHRPAREIAEAVKPVLSKPGGSIQAIGESDLLLISDLKAKVDQALALVERLDRPGPPVIVVRVELKSIGSAELVATATQVALTRDTIEDRPLAGKLIAESGAGSALIVAPDDEVAYWRDLIEHLDQAAEIETRIYSPRHFGLEEVAKLIEQTVGVAEEPRPGAVGGGDRAWRLVIDELTGSLIVTTTPLRHERISDLMTRLDETPAESRRSLRLVPVRHRKAAELREMLDALLEAGAVGMSAEVGSSDEGRVIGEAREGRDHERGELQRDERAPASTPATRGAKVETRQNGRDLEAERGAAPPSRLSLTVDEATNSIIAIGEPRLIDQLEDLLDALDTRQPQVMIETLVVSLNEAQTLDLGVELEKFEIAGETTIRLASLFGLSTSSDGGGRTVGDPAGGTAVVLSPGDFSIVIRALETLNEGRSLSVPKVLVSNNQTATLDSVLQQPFTQTNASDTVATTSFGGFENAGTTITVTPQITKGDHLLLEYAVALSSFVGESSDANIPPPRQQNKLESVATLPDSFVVAVGGLEMETEADAVSQVPLLGSIPIVGEAFRNRSKSRSRSRFFVFIRPTVLRSVRFEDLKYLSDVGREEAALDDGWPKLKPRLIHE